MHKSKRYSWAGLLILTQFFVSTLVSWGQPIHTPSRILTTKDGLPQSFVSGLAQDKAGFIWIGTRNGLARYDGHQFITFHYKQSDSSTLSSDVIISLRQDSHHQLWIEHESGEIDNLLPSTQRIERISYRSLYKKHPLTFARQGWTIDARGNLWGTQLRAGIWGYDWERKVIHHFTQKDRTLPSDTIRGIYSSRQGFLWLLSPTSLIQFNQNTGQYQSTALPFPLQVERMPSAAGGTVQLYEQPNGNLMWVYGGQLFVFSPVTHQFRLLSFPDQTYVAQCQFYTASTGYTYLAANNKVYQYDDSRGLITVGLLDSVGTEPKSLLVDRSNLIWVGGNATGIRQIDLSSPHFDSKPYALGFHEDVFRQELGVSLLNTFDWSNTDKNISGASYSLRSTYDTHNRLWIALHYQVAYYDSLRRQLIHLPFLPSYPAAPKRQWRMGGIRFDSEGTLWVADGNGYIVYFDKQQQRWIPWLTDTQLVRALGFTVFAVDLFVDEQTVWLTTREHGLIRINRNTRAIQRLTHATSKQVLPTNLLLGFQPDPHLSDRLWIGSYEGLVALDKRTLRSRVFTTADGLPDNTIYAIARDKAGFLWLSTNYGLCRFDPRTFQIRTFTSINGLLDSEFNRFHQLRLPDGRLAFGGTDGWILFNPDAVRDDHSQPPVALTNLTINNVAVPVTPGRNPLPVPINELRELKVPFAQNMISLRFAGLEYNQPSKLQYRYQLTGYDDEWVYAGHFPQATYTHLPPGQYTLRVNATNTTGQWSTHVHTLLITITPPWWRSWWAYLLYGLITILLTQFLVRLRIQRVREQQERVNQQKEAEQLRALNAMKSRFFANITHELQTPLNLILSPTQSLKAVIHESAWQQWLGIIDQNTQKLLTLINQLLDLSQLEAGVISVEEQQGDLGGFIEHLVAYVQPEAEAKGLQLIFTNQLTTTSYWFDADKLERITLNLLTNSIKFTQQGLITVTISPVEQGVRLLVEDTGIGIPHSAQEHIFDRYYQATDSESRQGTGIGLALVKELVTLQHGTVQVASQPASTPSSEVGLGQNARPGWTRFTIELPYRSATSVVPVYPAVSTEPATHAPLEETFDEQPLVLLVEDNADLSNFIAENFPSHYRIQQAADGLEGLEAALAHGPDLVISDVIMPRMDGYELCQRLKQDQRTSHIPIILLTAKATFDEQLQGLSYGADDYLTKPFYVKELQLRVQNLLDRQRRQRTWLRSQFINPAEPNVLSYAEDIPNKATPNTTDSTTTLTVANDSFLEELHTVLREHFSDTQFGVEELAMQMNLSRVHLYRKVKAISGLTVTELLRNYRLKQATRFLAAGLSIAETAFAVGFESPAYFTKCFRDLFGVTPSEFSV